MRKTTLLIITFFLAGGSENTARAQGYALTTLYRFTHGNDGNYPVAGLTQGRDGDFYGTTIYVGAEGNRTIFRLSATGAFNLVRAFTHDDGSQPLHKLLQSSDGNVYGTLYLGYLGSIPSMAQFFARGSDPGNGQSAGVTLSEKLDTSNELPDEIISSHDETTS